MTEDLHWHQALAYALTGERHPEFGTQARPDLDQLLNALAGSGTGLPVGADGVDGMGGLRDRIRAARTTDAWPRPVPADLARGLGPAQFAAALQDVRRRLETAGQSRPVLSSRRPDAAEQRLLRDVPPHHGS